MSHSMNGQSSPKKSISSTSMASIQSAKFGTPFQCKHKMDAPTRTVKNGRSYGRKFYGCALWPDEDCRTFKWVDEVIDENVSSEAHRTMVEKDTTLSKMEMELIMKNEKIIKLKQKKAEMALQMQQMGTEVCGLRVEVMTAARGDKIALMALIVSWVFFVILFLVMY